MDYTDAQRAAIETLDEPLLIVACAGSGKTQVISERIVEILRLPRVEPKDIAAFTFTEKAAAELKERVTELTTAAFPEMTGLAELICSNGCSPGSPRRESSGIGGAAGEAVDEDVDEEVEALVGVG